jgi:cell division protein FtsW (lipid II flippase)
VLAFSTWSWGVWIALLCFLLIVWRPYVWEGLAVLGANLAMGIIALPLWQRLATYQQHRLVSFLNPDVDPRATGWHIIQSKIAIGSGGVLGKGFTLGSQKRLAFLPAQHTDFIFAVVGEELGFLGATLFVALFAVLIWRGLRIGLRTSEPFGAYLALGITLLLATQTLVNLGVVTGLLPTKGLPLPFVSFGGSALLMTMLSTGVLLNISQHAHV